MDVVLLGYGKMGKNIYRSLKKNSSVRKIYVVDPIFSEEQIVENQYKSFNDIPADTNIDAAFVASNSVTHFDVLKQVVARGIKDIFCEKPMLLTKREYQLMEKTASGLPIFDYHLLACCISTIFLAVDISTMV